jgi:hypothetical protein
MSNFILNGTITSTEPENLPEGLLKPGKTMMVRVEKNAGLIDGSFGP